MVKTHVPKSRWIEIYVPIYRLTVIVTWEPDLDKIIAQAKKRKVSFADNWKADILALQHGANGICAGLGSNNTDILVWLKAQPKKASEFGTLYHELYHAVDGIAEDHNLGREREARAYIFEFLANRCNQVLWSR